MATESTVDLDDVEDRLDIMEQVMAELQRPLLTKPDRQILMNQYRHLEDVILAALLDCLTKDSQQEFQLRLPKLIVLFNKVGADFQEGWAQDLWDAYEFSSNGFEVKEVKDKPTMETAQQIEHLQDLALTLSKLTRVADRHVRQPSLVPKPQTLAGVDQDSLQFREKQKQEPALEETTSRCRCTLM